MQTDPPAGVSASPIADNVMTWYITRFPPSTPQPLHPPPNPTTSPAGTSGNEIFVPLPSDPDKMGSFLIDLVCVCDIGTLSSSGLRTRRLKMAPFDWSCILRSNTRISRQESSSSVRCFIQTYTTRESCAWIYCKIGGVRHTMSPPY